MPSEDFSQMPDSSADTTNMTPIEVISADYVPSDGTTDEDVEAQLALRNLEKKRQEKRRKRRLTIIAAGVVIGGLVAFLLGSGILGGGGEAEEEEFVPETAIVEKRDFESSVSATGSLKAGSTVVVNSDVDGIIESVSVVQGDQVQKGDVLFTLKNDALDKEVRDAKQDLSSAQQSLSSAQNEVSAAVEERDKTWSDYYEKWNEADADHREWEYAVKHYDSDHAKWEDQKEKAEALKLTTSEPVAPTAPDPSSYDLDDPTDKRAYEAAQKTYQTDYDTYLNQKDAWNAYQKALARLGDEPEPAGDEPEYPDDPDDIALQSAIQSAQEGVTSANQSVTKAQEAYDEAVEAAEKRVVKAPRSGSIVAINVKVGDVVGSAMGESSAASTTDGPLVQISDIRSMAVDVEVNEIDILAVRKGQKAEATFSAVADAICEGEVTEVATVATGSEGAEGDMGGGIVTFHVGLVIPKPDKRLRPGMSASVRILTNDVPDALIIPTSALSEGASGASVEVVVDEETMETVTRPVKVGARSSSEAVIESGLQEGEVVLISGGGDEFEEF